MPDLVVEQGLGVGPGRVGVRVVGLDQDVVDADAVALLETGRVVDRAEPEVALQHLGAASARCRVHVPYISWYLQHVVEAVEQPGHPADAALRQADA